MKKTINSVYRQLIIENIKRYLGKDRAEKISNYAIAKESIKLKYTATRLVKDIVLISLGILSAGFGLKGFLLPNGFIDGGVIGISLLVEALTNYPLSILIVIINFPFIIMGIFQIGKSFAIKSVIAIVGLSIVLIIIDYPIITSDKLLIAVFGGFFLGAGIGLTVRGGGVIDGTEVLAIYLSKKTGLTIGDFILILNIIIFSIAAYLLSIEIALYSILTYLAASKTVDFIIEGVEEYIGVTIISVHSDQIRVMIIEEMRRGVTIYDGKRGFGKRGENLNRTDIVYTVITRLELSSLKTKIQKIDPKAFIVMNSVKDLKGGVIKKRPFKEK